MWASITTVQRAGAHVKHAPWQCCSASGLTRHFDLPARLLLLAELLPALLDVPSASAPTEYRVAHHKERVRVRMYDCVLRVSE
jgi:hypothetical protein